jgi:ABC-2 type transport system permease protein
MKNRTFIVARYEFLKRVKTRWFILTTLLGPLALIAFIVITAIVSVSAMKSGDQKIAVLDYSGKIFETLSDSEGRLTFVKPNVPEDSVRASVLAGTYDGYLVLDEDIVEGSGKATYYSLKGGGSAFLSNQLENIIEQTVETRRLEEQNVDPEVFKILSSGVSITMLKLSETGETSGNTGAYAAIGFVMGFLMYMTMLIYGSVVMQGVIQEKMNRVVEVIVSSVRPFQLLLGKVLGIGAMGLVQMVFWALLIMAGTLFSGAIIAMFLDPANLNLPATASQEEMLTAIDFSVPLVNPALFVWFVLYFLFGYLLYASLFSAVGSTVEQQQDAQSLMLPIMLPIIMSIVFLQSVIEAPDSTLAVVLSMIPLTSPISMVVRAAVTNVPFWEILISFALLVGAFFGCIWLSSRIYRVGILMYGKKASLKDLMKWVRYA